MQDIGTFSIDELIDKLTIAREQSIAAGMDPNSTPVYTVGPLGRYATIQAAVMENDGLYLNISTIHH